MQLSPQDIQRLYPARLYLVDRAAGHLAADAGEEAAPAQQPADATLQPAARDQPAITWRPKPNAQLSLLLAEAEFGQRELTELLKSIVKALEIPFDACGFGKLHGKLHEAELAEMPTRLGVLFGDEWVDSRANPLEVDGKQIYQVPSLAEMMASKQNKRIAWETLKGMLPALS